jgi:preprotein translocase subunit SecG
MLQSIILILHVLTCLMIVGLVLLQRGKGADAGTGFGAGASGTVFGARGSASFLSRATAALATTFFVTSLALAFFANEQTAPESVLQRTLPTRTQTQPQAAPPAAERDLDAPPALDLDSPPAVPDNTPATGAEGASEVPASGAPAAAESPETDVPQGGQGDQ